VNVHIVLWNDLHIIPRMAQWLVDAHGWTIGESPDPFADVNYYLPYLKWDFDSHPETRTAAWFTHFESGTPWKVEKWNDASAAIDSPFVTAPMYLSRFPERARLITPGVDTDRFVPFEVEHVAEMPIVGIVAEGAPRKGPHLVLDLIYGGVQVDLRIVGHGWPFPASVVSHEDMPKYYNFIDILLCPSLEEGIPGPVIEALACDTKLLVPENVGICSQLPEMPGLRHYIRGDSQDMLKVLKQVIADEPQPGSLRDVVEQNYTIKHWTDSHAMAMEALIDAPVFV